MHSPLTWQPASQRGVRKSKVQMPLTGLHIELSRFQMDLTRGGWRCQVRALAACTRKPAAA